MQLFNELRDRQMNVGIIQCTGSSNCWCGHLETKLPYTPGYDGCLSPLEILQKYGGNLSKKDVIYLESICGKPFVR